MRACTYCKKIRPASAVKCPDDGASLQDVDIAPVPAELLARFGTLEPFARGETGSLFLGPTDDAGAPLLLKIFADEVGASLAERTRWKREMRKQTALVHPHLPRMLDEGETAGRLWLLRAFAPGETLAVRTRRLGRLAVPDVLGVAAQVASALDELHRQGLVQRDVKPGHIVTLQRGQGPLLVQLIDSGSAGRLDTRAGLEIYGTPGYAAPEIAAGRPASFRSDLYALGCVMYELLTGRLPFLAATMSGLVQAQRDNDPEPLDPSLPAPVRNLISALLADDPRRRPFSAQQVRRTLEPFLPAGIPAVSNGGRSLIPPPSAASARRATSDKTQELAVEDLRAIDDRSLSFPTQELELIEIDGAPPNGKTQELELNDLESMRPRAVQGRTAAPSGARRSSPPRNTSAGTANLSRGQPTNGSSGADRSSLAVPRNQTIATGGGARSSAPAGQASLVGRAASSSPSAPVAPRTPGAPVGAAAGPQSAPRRSVPPPPPPEAQRHAITSAGRLRARGSSAPPPRAERTSQPTAAGDSGRPSAPAPASQPTAAGDASRRPSAPAPASQPTAASDISRRPSAPAPASQPTAAGDILRRPSAPAPASGAAARSAAPGAAQDAVFGRAPISTAAGEAALRPIPSVDDDSPTLAIPPRTASPVPYVREPAPVSSAPRPRVSSQFDLESLFDDSLEASPAADGGERLRTGPGAERPSSPVREVAPASHPNAVPNTPAAARSARAGFAAQMAARTVTLRGGMAAIGRGQPPVGAGEPTTQPGIPTKHAEKLSAVPAVSPAADGGESSAAAALAAQVRAEQARADAARAAELADAEREASAQFQLAENRPSVSVQVVENRRSVSVAPGSRLDAPARAPADFGGGIATFTPAGGVLSSPARAPSAEAVPANGEALTGPQVSAFAGPQTGDAKRPSGSTSSPRPGNQRRPAPLWWGVTALIVIAVSFRVVFGASEPRHASPRKHKIKPWQTQLIVPGSSSTATAATLAPGPARPEPVAPPPTAAEQRPGAAALPPTAAEQRAGTAALPPTAAEQAAAAPTPPLGAAAPEPASPATQRQHDDAPAAAANEARSGTEQASAKSSPGQQPMAADEEAPAAENDQRGTLSAAQAGKGFWRGGGAGEHGGVVPYRARRNPELDYKAKARQLYQAAQYKEAAEAYQHATHRSPSDAAAFAGLGASWLAAGVPEKSIAAYQRAVQLKPQVSGFQAALGRAYLAKGDHARARAAYGKALTLDPDNQAAKTGLATLH